MVEVSEHAVNAGFTLGLMIKGVLLAANAFLPSIAFGIIVGGAMLLLSSPGFAALLLGVSLVALMVDILASPVDPTPL